MQSRRSGIAPQLLIRGGAVALALGVAATAGAAAQTVPYETRLYRPPESTLDKNYGLPTFGLPGSELPKQRTMATPSTAPDTPGGQRNADLPDFLTSLGGSSQDGDITGQAKLSNNTGISGVLPSDGTGLSDPGAIGPPSQP